MTSNFEFSLYLSTRYQYKFSYPLDSKTQSSLLRQALKLSVDEFQDWKPNWQPMPQYEKKSFIDALTNNDFSFITEKHPCRELALSKGIYYLNWISNLSVVYRASFTILQYTEPIPAPFKDIVTNVLLVPYAVNRPGSDSVCNLDDATFGIGIHPTTWNIAWLSLLTYFAKYGTFLEDLAQERYGPKDQYDFTQVIRVILDSWDGQVGFYTAFGLWLWSARNEEAIHDSYRSHNGIHTAMDHYTSLYHPNKLLEFIELYDLDLSRVSQLFLQNHEARCKAAGLAIPAWFKEGSENAGYLAESPEWKEYMGYDDDDDDDDYDEDDYEFNEEVW